MKTKLTLFLLLILGLNSWSQTSYQSSQIAYAPDPFTAGTPLGLNFDDVWSAAIPLPFNFCFYDSTFDQIVVGSNGILTFDTSQANGFCPWSITDTLPAATYPSWSILGPYQDINPSAGGSISYDLRGQAPYRRFIVSYHQIPMFSCTNMLFSEQIILYETTNKIEIHMLDKPLCSGWNGGLAVLGIQKDGTDGLVASTYNFPNQWSAQTESWRFSPDGPCAGPSPSCLINGKVFADYNNNCVFDGNDAPIANRPILVDNGVYYTWTDVQGNYYVDVDTGNWVVDQVLPLYYGNNCAPAGGYNISFPTFSMTSLNNDFSDSVLVYCSDLVVDVGTFNMTRCFSEMVYLNYCNQGTTPDSGVVVTLTLDDSLSLDSSSVPYTALGGNMFEFNIGTLNPGQCGSAVLTVGIGCDSIGTVYCMDASIVGVGGSECDTTNNTAQDCHALVGSYDPNIKEVAGQDFPNQGWVTEDSIDGSSILRYMVHFQNTGTDTAFKVVIRDTLSNLLDPETIVVGAASHSFNWFRAGNELVFEFAGINLVDSATNQMGSHGFVRFSIQQQAGNGPGTLIENSSAIYFDFNPPIITNTTLNEYPLLISNFPQLENKVTLFPNPGRSGFAFEWQGSNSAEFKMVDLTGRTVLQRMVSSGKSAFSAQGLPAGLYLYELRQGQELLGWGKWVRE